MCTPLATSPARVGSECGVNRLKCRMVSYPNRPKLALAVRLIGRNSRAHLFHCESLVWRNIDERCAPPQALLAAHMFPSVHYERLRTGLCSFAAC